MCNDTQSLDDQDYEDDDDNNDGSGNKEDVEFKIHRHDIENNVNVPSVDTARPYLFAIQ